MNEVMSRGSGAKNHSRRFPGSLPCRLVPVAITGGDAATRDGQAWRTPERDLVSTVQMLLQSGPLRIAAGLPEAATLMAELQAFRVTTNPGGHDSNGASRERDHDDLVLALALACWTGEHDRPPNVWLIGDDPPERGNWHQLA